MTREEKIELVERQRDLWQRDADDHKKRGCMAHYEKEQAIADALTDAMSAMHSGWVRTSDKMPTEKDADHTGRVVALWLYDGSLRATAVLWDIVGMCSDRYIFWECLPEVEP